MKKKIVLMKARHGSVLGMTADDVTGWEKLDWVVISEPVEVDFPDLPKEVVAKNQIAELDSQVTQLKARKQELLAITHDTGE